MKRSRRAALERSGSQGPARSKAASSSTPGVALRWVPASRSLSYPATSKMISSSTGVPSGRLATPYTKRQGLLSFPTQALFFNFLAQFEDPLNQGLRTGRAAWDIDIDRHNRLYTLHGIVTIVEFPMLITHFGSGICSHNSRRRGPILIDTVPATIIRSAWRGLERNTSEPKRARSYCGADAAAINLMAQQARP